MERPRLPQRDLKGKDPPTEARKGARSIYWQGHWIEADIFEMDHLQPGNEIHGLAVVEAPSTTLMIPPDRYVILDEHLIFHMGAI